MQPLISLGENHRFDSRTAIVTGRSRGIGAATAVRLAADGLAVVLAYAPASTTPTGSSPTSPGPAAAPSPYPHQRAARSRYQRQCRRPRPTATALFLDGKDEQTIQRLASAPPLERLGTPEDTAETVAFLTGPGHWVNGQVLRANGGIV